MKLLASIAVAAASSVLMYPQVAFAVGAKGAGQAATPRDAAPTQPRPESPQLMHQGVVTAVSAQGDHVEIQGRAHFIAPGQTRFFRDGNAVTADALKKGQTLRFTLAGGSKDRPTLGVVYVP